jgi:HTH-type transcriptional regulator/antitoxin HigA
MDIPPVRSAADPEAALIEIERLWDALPGTPDHERLEILGTLVSAFEDREYPVGAPGP